MEFIIKKNNPVEFSVTITLSAEDYVKNVEENIKKYVTIHPPKGFRPGKIPFDIAKKIVGTEFIEHKIHDIVEDIIEKKATEIDTFYQENKCFLDDTIGRIRKGEQIIESYNARKPIIISYIYPLYDKETPISFENISLKIAKIRTTSLEINMIQDTFIHKFLKELEYKENIKKDFRATISFITKEGVTILEKFNILSIDINSKIREQMLTHSPEFPFDIETDIRSIFLNPISTKQLIDHYHEEQKITQKIEEPILLIVNVQEIIPVAIPDKDQTFFDNCFGKDAVHNEEEFLKKCEDLHKKYSERISINKYLNLFLEELFEKNKNILVNTNCYLLSKNHITEESLLEKEKKEFETFVKNSIINNLCIRILDSINIPINREDILEEFVFDHLINPHKPPFIKIYDTIKEMYNTYLFGTENNAQNDKEEKKKQQLIMQQYHNIVNQRIFEYIKQNIQLEIEEVDEIDFFK